MLRMILGCFWVLAALPGRTQTFTEWFSQNSTRLKYYGQQIAAFQVELGKLEKGYRISEAGLGAISGSKKAEYDLHNGYYASLGDVNRAIGELDEVAEIVSLQAAIIERFTSALGRYRSGGLLGADRLGYIGQVYSNVLQAGLADVEILTEVLTAHDLQMTDDQRMGRIRELDRVMRDRFAFTLAFTNGTDLLAQQQAREHADLGMLKVFYGLP